jgi:hypothetical protein
MNHADTNLGNPRNQKFTTVCGGILNGTITDSSFVSQDLLGLCLPNRNNSKTSAFIFCSIRPLEQLTIHIGPVLNQFLLPFQVYPSVQHTTKPFFRLIKMPLLTADAFKLATSPGLTLILELDDVSYPKRKTTSRKFSTTSPMIGFRPSMMTQSSTTPR